jgi:hypothetical protein
VPKAVVVALLDALLFSLLLGAVLWTSWMHEAMQIQPGVRGGHSLLETQNFLSV